MERDKGKKGKISKKRKKIKKKASKKGKKKKDKDLTPDRTTEVPLLMYAFIKWRRLFSYRPVSVPVRRTRVERDHQDLPQGKDPRVPW